MDRRKLVEAIENLSEEQRKAIEQLLLSFESHSGVTTKKSAQLPDRDAIPHYLDHPVVIDGIKAPTREELYRGR
jgi:hypothetical protein